MIKDSLMGYLFIKYLDEVMKLLFMSKNLLQLERKFSKKLTGKGGWIICNSILVRLLKIFFEFDIIWEL